MWYVAPVDARETYFWGFPFACVGEGWQTSGSLQIFLLEGLADLFIYFFSLSGIFFLLNRFYKLKAAPGWLVTALWTLSFSAVLFVGTIISVSYPYIKLTRDFEWRIIKSGYKFVWQQTPQPAKDWYKTEQHESR
jgi:hypothetical protein